MVAAEGQVPDLDVALLRGEWVVADSHQASSAVSLRALLLEAWSKALFSRPPTMV